MRHDENTRKQRPAEVTKAEVSRAIARGTVPYVRVGDQYVLRQEDLRKMRARRAEQTELAPKRDTLEMGRSA